VSFGDALIIAAACRRPIRFVIDHRIFPLANTLVHLQGRRAIPIAPEKEDAALKSKAFDDISHATHSRRTVCIFPEGNVTATGEITTFPPRHRTDHRAQSCPCYSVALRACGAAFSRACMVRS